MFSRSHRCSSVMLRTFAVLVLITMLGISALGQSVTGSSQEDQGLRISVA